MDKKISITLTYDGISISNATSAERKEIKQFLSNNGLGAKFIQLLLGDLEKSRIEND